MPCHFIRYLSNAKDDLDQLKFQLEANHYDNYPADELAKQQEESKG